MGDGTYDDLYNRALDVTAVVHILVKLVTMFVVLKYTPKSHRYHSYFVLHIMFWNFMCNLIMALVHGIPLYPAECFRLGGLLSLFIDSESFGHAMLLAELTTTTHCTLALASAFAHRYIVFAHPDFAAKTKPNQVVMLCCGIHLFLTFLLIPLSLNWKVSYDDYPEKAELPDRYLVFCFYPYGVRKFAGIITYGVFILLCVVAGTVFSALFMANVRSRKHAIHSQTIALQKKLFVSLLIITAISVCFPHLPYARYTTMVSMVILCNHGSIYCVAYLILFKAYHNAVRRMIFKFVGKEEQSKAKIVFVQSSAVIA